VVAFVHHLDPPVQSHAVRVFGAAPVRVMERAPHAGDALPAPGDVDAIVTFGGAQSVLDLDGDPALAAEGRWLADAVARGVPVLGVCLGAQLLAHTLGGRVFRLPRRQVTWLPLEPTEEARADPLLGALPATAHGLHWNEDGFEPPPGAVELLRRAPRAGCLAFRHGPAAWGVQFHPEVDAGELEHWYAAWQPALAQAGVTEAAARELDRRRFPGQGPLADAIFSGFARVVAGR
jgi:GMP synthase (glutamine-hydrolysing)